MNIQTIRHKGLKRLIEQNDDREVRPDWVRRVRNILAALISAADIEGVQGPPGLAHSSTFRQPLKYLEHIGFRQLANHL
jgi:hypothetical protein